MSGQGKSILDQATDAAKGATQYATDTAKGATNYASETLTSAKDAVIGKVTAALPVSCLLYSLHLSAGRCKGHRRLYTRGRHIRSARLLADSVRSGLPLLVHLGLNCVAD